MKINQRKAGAILSYITIFLNIIISIAYTPILTRNLGNQEYGLYSLVDTIISYLTVLDFGFSNAIIIYTVRYKAENKKTDEQKMHGMFFIIYSIIGVIAGIIGFILVANINNLFSETMSIEELRKARILMTISVLNIVLTFAFSIFPSIINAYEKFVVLKLVNIINLVLKPLIMIPLLYVGYKSIALIIVTTGLNIITLIINMLYCVTKLKIRFIFGKIDFKLLFGVMSYSVWIFLNSIVDKIAWSIDQFVLGIVSGTVMVSVYSIASKINSLYLMSSGAITNVLLPKIVEMEEKNDTNEDFSKIFIRIGRIQFLILAIVLSGFIIYGREFINLWVGSEYANSYIVAVILMIPVTIPLIQNIGINILQAKNKYKYRVMILLFASVINLIITFPLARRYGAIGSALGTAISNVIGAIIGMNIYYMKVIKIDILNFWKNILRMLIIVCIVSIIGLEIKKVIIIKNYIYLFINICIYSLIYISAMFFIVMNEYEKNLIIKPLKAIAKK